MTARQYEQVTRGKLTPLDGSVLRVLVGFLLAVSPVSAEDAVPSTKEEFLETYSNGVQPLLERYRHMSITCRLTEYRQKGGEPIRQSEERYDRSGDLTRRIRDRVLVDNDAIRPGNRDLTVANADMSFRLLRGPGSTDYSMDQMRDYDDAMYGMQLRAKPLFAPYCFLELTIARFFEEKTFNLLSVERDVDAATGEPVIKAHWERPYGKIYQSGWFAFLPEQSWALREWFKENKKANNPDGRALLRCRMEYGELVEGVPIISHVRQWTEFYGYEKLPEGTPLGVPINIAEYEVVSVELTDLDPKEFTLQAYGFPNPGQITSQWGRVFMFANLGVLLLVIAFLLWRLSQRTTRTPQ